MRIFTCRCFILPPLLPLLLFSSSCLLLAKDWIRKNKKVTEATFESVKGKLEVIAPNLRHSHAAKITIFCNITSYEQNTLISKEKWSHDGPNAERFFGGLTSITLKMNTRYSCLEWGIVLFIMDESHLSQGIKKVGYSRKAPRHLRCKNRIIDSYRCKYTICFEK